MRPHLLVPTDFSMPAKKMLRNLDGFRYSGAERITLLHVREVGYPVQSPATQESYYKELLEEAAVDLRARGWEVETMSEKGRPGPKIVDVCDEVDADMIVIANHGHGALSEVILGSVATEVLERSKKPVFLFSSRGVEEPLWDRVVYPTDFSKAAKEARNWATEIALYDGLSMVLLHSVDDRYTGDKMAQKRRSKLKKMRTELLEEGVTDVELQLVSGPPKKMVVEAAEHYPGALFVMGTHGRGWFGDLMLGGVSRAMARRGSHHVLFVR